MSRYQNKKNLTLGTTRPKFHQEAFRVSMSSTIYFLIVCEKIINLIVLHFSQLTLMALGIVHSVQITIYVNNFLTAGMKVACKLGREVLEEAARVCDVGVTTDEIDRVVHEACIERECYPSPLNYYEFPASCCTSVNEVICHGIPDLRPLEDGDICNVDITVYHREFHGDLNETFLVGNVSDKVKDLVKVTHECLQKAIEIVRPGEKYREIGNVIQRHAQSHGYAVVKSYCGHGIHRLFHTAPNVPHYASKFTYAHYHWIFTYFLQRIVQ